MAFKIKSELENKVTKLINRARHTTLQDKRTQREITRLQNNAINAAVAYTEQGLKGTANHLISGSAVWDTGLTFRVTQCVYVIANVTYISLPQSVTLADADATNPRIDVIQVSEDGTASVVTGVASATPVKPEYNAEDSVEVTFVTVSALATTPDGVGDTIIYDEDDDWTSAVTANVESASTASPYAGTKHIRFANTVSGNYITLTDSVLGPPGDVDVIKMYVKNNDVGGRQSKKNVIRIALFSGSNRVSSWLNLIDGRYGFQYDAAGYQLIALPMAEFSPDGSTFDVIKMQALGDVNLDIDNISSQVGVVSTDVSNYALLDATNVFTKAQASRITTLTDGATITVDLSLGNVFEVTLDGNRTIDFINATAGQHFTMVVIQDDTTGGRTLTWDAANDWAGATAPTLSTATDAVDILTFMVDSSGNIHGSLGIADSK